jgi:hypothetical protein
MCRSTGTCAVALAALLAVVACTPGSGSGDADADADADSDADGERQCGDERQPVDLEPSAIVNGSESWDPEVVDLSEGQAMAVGALMVREPLGWGPACTAALVAPRVVLTAAHCVLDPMAFPGTRALGPNRLHFGVGEDMASPAELFEVDIVSMHPDYRRTLTGNAEHDVAVLVLREDATAVVPGIEPIAASCSPLAADALVGQDVQNVGYGATTPEVGESDNTRRFWTVEEVTALSEFDLTVYGHGVSAVCHGDSGGPALWTMPDGVVRTIGVASWGDPSCVDSTHYARVDAYCDFLADSLGGCGEETASGRCEAETAIYCDGGAVMRVDCAATGRTCGDEGGGRLRCLDATDRCAGETLAGRCEAETAIWCEANEVRREDCGAAGLACGPDAEARLRCDVPPECDALGWAGRCDGQTATWCEAGELRVRRCADCGQVCGFSETHGGAYCL